MLDRIKKRYNRIRSKRGFLAGVLAVWPVIIELVGFWETSEFIVGKVRLYAPLAAPIVAFLLSRAGTLVIMFIGLVWLAVLIVKPEKRLAAEDLRRLDAKQLRTYTAQLTQNLREIEADQMVRNRDRSRSWFPIHESAKTEAEGREVWEAEQADYIAKMEEQQRNYLTRFHGDVMALYDELRERVGDIGILHSVPHSIPILLTTGMLAGPHPIREAADYLDRMALRLRDSV